MCHPAKLYAFIILALTNEKVFCWQEDQTNDNTVTRSKKDDCNPDTIGFYDAPCSINLSNEGHSVDDSEKDYSDRIIFPDEYYNSPKWRSTSTSTSSPQTIQDCLISCSTNTIYDPVCGTDGITYKNLEQLECKVKCGFDVRIRQFSACTEIQVTTTTSPNRQPEVLRSCLFSCPTTPEYNPVCGTDNITYFNYGKLICAQMCGVDVKLERHSTCPKQQQTTTVKTETSSQKSDELSEEFFTCLKVCPTTSEYNPVCGSNNKTYYNLAKLNCARSCGVDVTFVKRLPC